MPNKRGRHAIVEQFLADGIRYMFGNPGTSEEGFLDAVGAYPDFRYILALQESVAVAMADGYARSTQRPAVVQLHSGVGLGNGIGMLYQAFRGHSPLVVIAGEAGIQYDAMDGQMAADLVAIARPVTKWATRVVHLSSVLRVLRRAIKTAATPPTGPVFVALPMDVLDAPTEEPVVPTSFLTTRVAPESDDIQKAATLMAASAKPLIVIGDGIAMSGALEELERVAELTGAGVWGANSSEVNIRATHPLFRGLLGHMFGFQSTPILSQADVVLICGTTVLPEVFPDVSRVFAPGAKVIHIDQNAYEIAKNYPVTMGLVSDPKITLDRLAVALKSTMTNAQKKAAADRVAEIAALGKQERAKALAGDEATHDAVPMHASRFAKELARYLPEDAMIFDEALTHSPELVRYLVPGLPGHYFQTRGGSLGVGIPGAIGIKLAHPDKTVIGFTGDGGNMYTIQALWTAAHYRIDAKFVVCNNRSYRLLKLNLLQYWRERQLSEEAFPSSFDICDPDIRFDTLAEGMGVRSARVETPKEISPAIQQALAHDGPFLIDLVLGNEVPGSKIGCKCGQ